MKILIAIIMAVFYSLSNASKVDDIQDQLDEIQDQITLNQALRNANRSAGSSNNGYAVIGNDSTGASWFIYMPSISKFSQQIQAVIRITDDRPRYDGNVTYFSADKRMLFICPNSQFRINEVTLYSMPNGRGKIVKNNKVVSGYSVIIPNTMEQKIYNYLCR